MIVVEIILFLGFDMHEQEVANQIGLAERHTLGVETFEDLVWIFAVELNINKFKTRFQEIKDFLQLP